MPPARAAKLIARAGLASRREAESWILAGRVTYKGEPVAQPSATFPDAHGLEVDGKPLPPAAPTGLWLYHKPLARLVARRAARGERVIYHDLPPSMQHLMPVGRLDRMSEGLLLLTNDGGLARHLELPASGYQRVYHVGVKGRVEDKTLAPLREGLVLDGERFRPASLRHLARKGWLEIVLREGKKREIRRMMQAVGLQVERLRRVAYGPFRLDDLPLGQTRAVPTKRLPQTLPRFFTDTRSLE